MALWTLAALADLLAPRLLRGRLVGLRFDARHMPERFGVFLLIAIGESIVATGVSAAAAPHLTAGRAGAVATAFVLALRAVVAVLPLRRQCDPARAGDRGDPDRRGAQRSVVRALAFIAMAGGLSEVVAHPGEHPHAGVAALLFGGCALFPATFGYTRWRMFRLWAKTRLPASAVVLALLPFAPRMPALAALAMLATTVIALNLLGYHLVRLRGTL